MSEPVTLHFQNVNTIDSYIVGDLLICGIDVTVVQTELLPLLEFWSFLQVIIPHLLVIAHIMLLSHYNTHSDNAFSNSGPVNDGPYFLSMSKTSGLNAPV